MTVKTKKCSEPDCPRDVFAKGRCGFHYRQHRAEQKRSHDATTKSDMKCNRKNCWQCRLLAETGAHVDVPARPPFEFVGREQDL
jgi:hypothetical protein